MRLCGISSRFQLLSPCVRQVIHALLTRPPLSHRTIIPEGNQVKCFVRLACVKHAASVHPEPGSNSHKKFFPFQNQLANFNHSLIPNQKLTFLFSRYSSNLTASSSIFLITLEYCFRLLWLSSLLFSRTHLNRELLRCSQWIFQGYFTVQLSKFFVCHFRSATFICYHRFLCLSTTFLTFLKLFFKLASFPRQLLDNTIETLHCQHFFTYFFTFSQVFLRKNRYCGISIHKPQHLFSPYIFLIRKPVKIFDGTLL